MEEVYVDGASQALEARKREFAAARAETKRLDDAQVGAYETAVAFMHEHRLSPDEAAYFLGEAARSLYNYS